MAVQISTLSYRQIPDFVRLLHLGFDDELGRRGTDFRGLEGILRLLLAGGGIPLGVLTRATRSMAVVLVAESDGQAVGCLAVLGRGEPSFIGASVLPEFQGQGIGLALLNEGIRRVRARGCRRARAAAITDEGRRLAERAGFVAQDTRVLFTLDLPKEIPVPAGISVRRARPFDRRAAERGGTEFRWDDPRRPQEILLARCLLGIRTRAITALDRGRPTLCCTLSALRSQTIGEIRPQLAPDAGPAFQTCLAEGSRWLSQLGKREAYLYLPPAEETLVAIARRAGFEERQAWVQMAMDLHNAGHPSP